MRLNATCIILMSVSWATAIRPVMSQDDSKDAAFGPFEAAEVQCMKHADAIYVFTVKANSPETPNQKDLRRLDAEAREALLGTLCNSDNWNWVTGGEPCEDRDVGVLFEKGKDQLILRFCSKPADYTGFDADGTFNQKPAGGWIKQQPWESWKRRFAHAEMR